MTNPIFPLTLDNSPVLATLTSDLLAATRNGVVAASVTAALGRTGARVEWLPQEQRRANHDRYARHLLHADPAGLFSILAIVWAPGQKSPVHSHLTWCSVSVLTGTLTESIYTLHNEQPALLREDQHAPGALTFDPADGTVIHRLANNGGDSAISLHVYGVGADLVNTGINRLYAAA